MAEHPMTDAEGASVGLKPADVAAMNKEIEQRMANVTMSNHASNYDAKTNRCYIEIVKQWRYGRQFELEAYTRELRTTTSALMIPTRTWIRKCARTEGLTGGSDATTEI
jgi:hypothetical protein